MTSAPLRVRFERDRICYEHPSWNLWPGVVNNGTSVNANPWVIVERDGKWYAATHEWLRTGSKHCKPTKTVCGDHIKVAPLDTWKPHMGERIGFMVSGLARTPQMRNVEERTPVAWIDWPLEDGGCR